MVRKLPGMLFDMDGVIVDTNRFHTEAIRVFCRQHHVKVTEEQLEQRVFGRTNRDWIPEVLGPLSIPEIDALADEKELLFREMYAPHVRPTPGLLHFLDSLKNLDYALAVATSAPGENATFILNRLGIMDRFDAVLDSSSVSRGKPHPEIYLLAAAALGKKASSCVVFEDSISGVAAGLAAGSMVGAIKTTHTAAELKNADFVFRDFSELTPESVQDRYDRWVDFN